MDFAKRFNRCIGILAFALVAWAALAQATPDPRVLEPRQLKQTLCSSQNTASSSANLSIWQTNGLCSDFCTAKNAAFAIVQWQSCWCSDVAPATSSQAEVGEKCNAICPGYDIESCGSRPGWYGYLALAKNPISTADGGSSGGSSSTAPTTSTRTTQLTSTRPGTTVQTVTADGTVRTIFITPTATGTEGATGASEVRPSDTASGNGPSTGAVVGIVVGVIAAVVALAGLGLFLFFRRRRQRQVENDKYDEPSHRGSSAGMTSSPRNPEMVVTVDGGRWDDASEQRRSRLIAHDPRLDPVHRNMFIRNKSAESINTLRDDQDYSRKVHQPVLRAVNPDPNPE
ncbi:Cell wall integrity and stress response component 4 [Colletotrichum chlorophyti]|uniref:Cell wall integrity and stress response component 4 n=1 Tax=Colletotrichum chlorophyti TaxID=708187 RepID=A0A1Q8S7V6_9PEZI|nr:Cell wall integrity and stress response component 4 [Colletotrichum chlorophyti]